MNCSPTRTKKHDYSRVPVETAVSQPSDDQKEILSTFGIPHAVWQKPFGIFEWVYCTRGSPTRVFDLDEHGSLLGQGGSGGSKDLCRGASTENQKHPLREDGDGDLGNSGTCILREGR